MQTSQFLRTFLKKAWARAGKTPMILGQKGYGISHAIMECWSSFAFTYYRIFLHVSHLLQIHLVERDFQSLSVIYLIPHADLSKNCACGYVCRVCVWVWVLCMCVCRYTCICMGICGGWIRYPPSSLSSLFLWDRVSVMNPEPIGWTDWLSSELQD